MKKTIASVALSLVLVAGFAPAAHAQVVEPAPSVQEVNAQIIALLQQMVAILQAQLDALRAEREQDNGVEEDEDDTNSNAGNGQLGGAEPEEADIDVSLSYDAGSRDLHFSVEGDWDRASEKLIMEDGHLLVETGSNPPNCEFNIRTTCGENEKRNGRMGHFFSPNSVPPGTYTWEVTATKDGRTTVETGTFVAN